MYLPSSKFLVLAHGIEKPSGGLRLDRRRLNALQNRQEALVASRLRGGGLGLFGHIRR
jgi:hypothetical protein